MTEKQVHEDVNITSYEIPNLVGLENPKQAKERFINDVPQLHADFTHALRTDRVKGDAWARRVVGLDQDAMFDQLLEYTIEGVCLQMQKENYEQKNEGKWGNWEEDKLNGLSERIDRDFAPEGTQANEAFGRMYVSVTNFVRNTQASESGAKNLMRSIERRS